MAGSSSPKITGESVLSGCGKLSGGWTVQADPCPAWFGAIWTGEYLVTGWRCLSGRLFSSPALFLASSYSSLFDVLNGKGPPVTSFLTLASTSCGDWFQRKLAVASAGLCSVCVGLLCCVCRSLARRKRRTLAFWSRPFEKRGQPSAAVTV